MNTTQYKELKGINKTKRNLRDSMGKLEIAITNLAEVTANEIHNTNNSFGLDELKDDVQEAGKIIGKARKEIEGKIGKRVVDKSNYKNLTNFEPKKLLDNRSSKQMKKIKEGIKTKTYTKYQKLFDELYTWKDITKKHC